jgi:hypothetical protein
MWIMMSNSFVSIVKEDDSDLLRVRARRSGDIERLLGKKEIVHDVYADYAFRTTATVSELTDAFRTELATRVTYRNYKDAVAKRAGPKLHDALMRVYEVMAELQTTVPYMGWKRNRPTTPLFNGLQPKPVFGKRGRPKLALVSDASVVTGGEA